MAVARAEAKVVRRGDFKRDFRKLRNRLLRSAVDRAFNVTTAIWPVDTYWSLANHRINIQGRNQFALRPPNKPEQSGALASFAPAQNQREISKLDNLSLSGRNKRIKMGNPVPYAIDVGNRNNNGIRIYTFAARTAVAEVKQVR